MKIKEFQTILKKHDKLRNDCLNLIASENITSKNVRLALASDIQHRYYFTNNYLTKAGFSYQYRGTNHIKEMIDNTKKLAMEVFDADYVNLDMLSGHISNLNILFSYCKPGDTVFCSNTEYGGYPGLAFDKLPKYLGLKIEYIPQSEVGGAVNLELLKTMIHEKSPKIVILSSSITLFPFPVKEVSSLCREKGIIFVYDASHPLGLIAGKQFQEPFKEGADIIIGSTHKTFPGPQGGIILGKGNCSEIMKATDFVTVDNIHINRIAALGVALLEMKEYGEEYAIQIVKNAIKLASALEKIGINVRYRDYGYTQSHQFILEWRSDYSEFTNRLEQANIILDNSNRIGLSEITRYGMTEEDMVIIASFFERVNSGESPKAVKRDVVNFKRSFSKLSYCFS